MTRWLARELGEGWQSKYFHTQRQKEAALTGQTLRKISLLVARAQAPAPQAQASGSNAAAKWGRLLMSFVGLSRRRISAKLASYVASARARALLSARIAALR